MSGFFYEKNKSKKFDFVKIIRNIFLMIFALFTVINPVSIKVTQSQFCSKAYSFPSFEKFIKTLFNVHDEKVVSTDKTMVYLGGYPLGFTFNCSGVLVVAISNDNIENLKEGDVIKKIEDFEINNVEEIADILNKKINSNRIINLKCERDGKEIVSKLKPTFDEISGSFKLGLWIRDNAAGVGTMTYIRKDNLRFGALGHPVCDIDTGSIMPVSNGNIYKCNIVGYKKGAKGNPGELKGLFLRNGNVFGSLDKNCNYGVYGNFSDKQLIQTDMREIEVASRDEVKSGKAYIRCSIDGYVPQEYEIEIVKTYFQTNGGTKSMFIRVTDKELLEKTGGIVQGMSGSPIVQNGKLVGAVTHVFVSDPTKGYGLFADIMINN